MNTDHSDTAPAMFKLMIAWAGALIGSITLQHIVLVLTGIYTAVQLYILVRDKILDRRP